MSDDATLPSVTPVLVSLMNSAQAMGDPAIFFPSPSLGSMETIVEEARRRGLRVAGMPNGGIGVLPPLPLSPDAFVRLCIDYCTAASESQRGEIRRHLYLEIYPLFHSDPANRHALYHPADYIIRILQLCHGLRSATVERIRALEDSCPYLHISPVKEICALIRQSASEEGAYSWNGIETSTNSLPSSVLAEQMPAVPSHAEDLLSIEQDEKESNATREALIENEDLTGLETVDAVPSRNVEYLMSKDFHLISRSCVISDKSGDGSRVVAVYIANALSPELCREAAEVLEPAATKKNMRAATNGGELPDTGIVGHYDYLTNPTPYKCRETQFSRTHRQELEKCGPFLSALDKVYEAWAPLHHRLQKAAIPTSCQLFETAFSTVTVNRNFRTAVHTDKGDFKSGLGVLCVVNGDFEGCHLAIKQTKKCFKMNVGDVLLFDTSLEHGNTEVLSGDGWSRTSVVCYLRQGLLSSLCEMERRKQLNWLLMSQMKGSANLSSCINLNEADKNLPPIYIPVGLVKKLAPVQAAALSFASERMRKRTGCVLAMTMGLGKTLVALTLCYSYLHMYPDRDILILTPKPIIGHWIEEQTKWAHEGLSFKHFIASDGLNAAAFDEKLNRYSIQLQHPTQKEGHLFVLNPEYLPTFQRRFSTFSPVVLIVDEGHRVGSKGNKLTNDLDKLHCPLRVILSGTPLQNDAWELYRLVGWVDKGVHAVLPPPHFQLLADKINRYVNGNDDAFEDAVWAQKYLRDWMAGFVFREMENNLPPLHDYLLICASSAVQRHYEEKIGITKDSAVALSASEHRPYHLSTHPTCYLAFICGAYNSVLDQFEKRMAEAESGNASVSLDQDDVDLMDKYDRHMAEDDVESFIDDSGKLRALVDIVRHIKSIGEKVIIFSQYVGVQDLIHRVLTAARLSAFTIRGRDTISRRRKAIRDFKENLSLTALVLSTRIAAYGLDFTAANHVILFDSWWNPQIDAQAIARAYRRNQVKPVTVYRVATAVEDKFILKAQARKIALFRCIMQERTSRTVSSDEWVDCMEGEQDERRRELWRRLKEAKLDRGQGDSALQQVYHYSDTVRDG